MATDTIARTFDTYGEAQAFVNDLQQAGIPHADISLVANAEAHGPTETVTTTHHPQTGAVLGTLVGGGAGLLAGIGSLAIPGIGPVVAAGWLVTTLAGAGIGAAGGGLIGSLAGAGISHDEATVHAESVRRGATLVTVRVDDVRRDEVEAILARHHPADWRERRASYGDDWKGFDESAMPRPGYTSPANRI